MTLNHAQRRHLMRSRAAVFGLFVSFGLIGGTWAAHLPSVKAATNASTSMLGLLLLVLGLGAVAGMQFSGVLVDRVGPRPVAVAGVSAMAVAVLPPLAASTVPAAAAGAVALGLATGAAEVGMNAVAVEVEREYQRPIMAAFHAMFSVGSVCGAGLGAAGFALGASTIHVAIVVSVMTWTVMGVVASVLVRDKPAAAAATQRTPDDTPRRPASRAHVAVLCLLAFVLLLAEGSAMDWSSLHARQRLHASPAAAALALGCFVAAMTIGRFSADKVVTRVGAVAVVRWGAAAAVVGFAVVIAAPVLPVACLGWVLLGIGLSGCFPLVVTAAGNVDGASGRVLSQVVGCGYVAILAGPGAIGWLADHVTLNRALLLPACALVVCVCAAGAVRRD